MVVTLTTVFDNFGYCRIGSVVAVGQLKLQSGTAVAISTDAPPPIPANPPRY